MVGALSRTPGVVDFTDCRVGHRVELQVVTVRSKIAEQRRCEYGSESAGEQRRLRRRTTIKIISEKNHCEISKGSVLCEEGLRHAEALGNRCAESAGDQADAELQVQGVCEGDFRLDALLLIEIETVDRTGTFLGSLWESRTNMAIALVEAGLAKYTSFADSDRVPDAHLLLEQA